MKRWLSRQEEREHISINLKYKFVMLTFKLTPGELGLQGMEFYTITHSFLGTVIL